MLIGTVLRWVTIGWVTPVISTCESGAEARCACFLLGSSLSVDEEVRTNRHWKIKRTKNTYQVLHHSTRRRGCEKGGGGGKRFPLSQLHEIIEVRKVWHACNNYWEKTELSVQHKHTPNRHRRADIQMQTDSQTKRETRASHWQEHPGGRTFKYFQKFIHSNVRSSFHEWIYLCVHLSAKVAHSYSQTSIWTYLRTRMHVDIQDVTLHYITLHYITLHYITLHYITLHYITLHYITLHYITLHYITLHYITLHYITLHYITLHYITLHYITLHYITLHYITLHYITLHYITLHYITLHYITLHYITLHYITLHYITLHYITLHYITLHYITLHYITLHYITLHYITLHYITLHYITIYRLTQDATALRFYSC